MPVFNTTVPVITTAPKYRGFQGNWWDKTKLAISGSNADGSDNVWGGVVNAALPVVLGAISTYYTGSYQLGSQIGGLANKGLDSWTNKQLRGTDAKQIAKQSTTRNEKIRGYVGAGGQLAASIYSAAGGETNGLKNLKANNAAKDSLDGVSDQSIMDYLGGEGISVPSESKGTGDGIFANIMDFLSGEKNNTGTQGNTLDSLSKLLNNTSDSSIQQYLQGEDIGSAPATSSVIGSNIDGVKMLDDRRAKSKGLPSSLPYNMFSSPQMFRTGGEANATWKNFVAANVGFNGTEGLLSQIKTPDQIASETIAPGQTSGSSEADSLKYLVEKKGLNPIVASGIVGNLMQESKLNPNTIHDNGTGYGIAGWRDPRPGVGRKTALGSYLKMRGKPMSDLYGQLDFLVDEANQRGDISRASSATSPAQAAQILSKKYFRPAEASANNRTRGQNAMNLYNQYYGGMKKSFRNGGIASLSGISRTHKIYEDDDTTEDYYMVDIDLVKELGLGDLMETLHWGKARYGERILDQKSNQTLKEILFSEKPESEKKQLLGEHIFTELQTHDDISGILSGKTNFAAGGESLDLIEQLKSRLNIWKANGSYKSKQKNLENIIKDLEAERISLRNGELSDKTGKVLLYDIDNVDSLIDNYTSTTKASSTAPVDTATVKPALAAQRTAAPAVVQKGTTSTAGQPTIQERRARRRATGSAATPPPAEVTTSSGGTNYVTSIGAKSDIKTAQKLYNDWAIPNKLPTIPVDGVFGDQTATAIANYNADPANLRKINTSGITRFDPKTKNTSYLVNKLGLTEMMPGINVPSVDRIVGYDKNGNAQLAPAGVSVNQVRNPRTGRISVLNDDYLDDVIPGWSNAEVVPAEQTPLETEAMRRANQFKVRNAVQNGIAGATTLIGALALASSDLPKWGPTDEYGRLKDEIIQNKDQGFSPAETANINQSIQQNYANGVGAIRQIAGNGGNQGSILGTLGSLSANADNSYLQAEIQNNSLRRQNFNRYQNFITQDLNIDRTMFEQDYNNAAQQQQTALQLISSGVNDLSENNAIMRDYGPDSIYNALNEAQLSGAQRENEIRAAQALAFAKSLGSPAVPQVASPGATPLVAQRRVNPLAAGLKNIVVQPIQ